jgi:hypothetical protein
LFKKETAHYSEIQMEHKGEAFDCSTWWYTQSPTRLKCFALLRDTVLSPANMQTWVNFYQQSVGVLHVNNSWKRGWRLQRARKSVGKKCCFMPFRSVSLLKFLHVHWKYKAWNKTGGMWMFVSWCKNKQSSERNFQSACKEWRISHVDVTFNTYSCAVNRCAFEIQIE